MSYCLHADLDKIDWWMDSRSYGGASAVVGCCVNGARERHRIERRGTQSKRRRCCGAGGRVDPRPVVDGDRYVGDLIDDSGDQHHFRFLEFCEFLDFHEFHDIYDEVDRDEFDNGD